MTQNSTFLSTIRRYVNSSVLLIAATVAALVVANLPATSQWYQEVWKMPVCLSIGGFNLFSHGGHAMSFGAFINDFLMAIFFLSVGFEIKREVLCGELSTLKKAMLPVIGACGGMLVPVLIFFALCILTSDDPVATRGMAIPMATDIAFSLGVLSMFSKRVPVGLKIFLAALAVADDLGGIIVIAIRYTDHLSLPHLGGVALCVLLCLLAAWKNVLSKMYYFLVGIVMWYCMLNSGIHATIAGVILAFCVPAKLHNGTAFYIERIRKSIAHFPQIEVSDKDRKRPNMLDDEAVQVLRQVEDSSDHLISTLQDMEDVLRNPINYIVIPLFAFANAGVCFEGMSLMNLFQGVGLSVFLGLLIGKFTGVLSFSWLSMKLGFTQMPENSDWKSFAGVCMLCGIGFTVSMFMADLSYSPVDRIDLLNDAKLGILCGTVASALVGSFMLNKTLPKQK